MWILSPLEPGGETHYLLSTKEYVVGRKNCDILLTNDQSISRAHAHLTATDQALTVKDTSKYGTFVNGRQLAANAPVTLTTGDRVTFGVFHSKFSVDRLQPVVCSSCVDNSGKAELCQALLPVGGKLVNTWSEDCTHLVMPAVKVTIKTISALLCCRPIVTPAFFSELLRAAQQKLLPPQADRFLPDIDEPSLSIEGVNLGPVPARQQLFTGTTFVFLSDKQRRRLSAAVGFGGGRTQVLQEDSLPRDLLESPQSCVVDVTSRGSQTLLPSSTIAWANSVKSIVQRKGLRVITESEIGLAVIHASRDKYCNPSSLTSDSVPKVQPRIPGASLSQSITVDETVLPAASQNITAYAVNTEMSQRTRWCEVSGVSAVAETPEKKQSIGEPSGSAAWRMSSQFVVAETVSSSLVATENTNKQRRPESKPSASCGGSSGRPSFPKSNCGAQKHSPHQQRSSAQTSPQKQSVLTTFFQPANKKRPLEDHPSPVTSQPKRLMLQSGVNTQTSDTSPASNEPSATSPTSQVLLGSEVSPSDQMEPPSRKRKEMEAEMDLEELESIMSQDMDAFDEQPPSTEVPPQRLSAEQTTVVSPAHISSSAKRQRIGPEEDPRTTRQAAVSIRAEQPRPADHESHRSAGTSHKPLEDSRGSHVDGAELLRGDIFLPGDGAEAPLRPVTVKQEPRESEIDGDLPKKLLLVEFRCLTVSAAPQEKPQQMMKNGCSRNFKCFRKVRVPGSDGSPHVIGAPDLLVHNRGKNSDVDEWLKDAAEEERQSRQEEREGDDLFRYNPTKLTKRR